MKLRIILAIAVILYIVLFIFVFKCFCEEYTIQTMELNPERNRVVSFKRYNELKSIRSRFIFVTDNATEVELRLREDGVVVWREVE